MRLPAAFAALFFVACGASTESTATRDGGPVADATSTDAAIGDDAAAEVATGDGGCILPVEGAACRATDVVCPRSGDVCCIGYVWSCEPASGQWTKVGLGCPCMIEDTGSPEDSATATETGANDAGPFACGAQTCADGQLCTKQASGIDGGSTYYSCRAMPTACTNTPTCACVKSNIGPSCYPTDCAVDTAGHVTLGCMGA